MNSAQWDAHKRKWCESCTNNRRGSKACPVIVVMEDHPDDLPTSKIFAQLGRCSQYKQKPQKQPKKQSRKKK